MKTNFNNMEFTQTDITDNNDDKTFIESCNELGLQFTADWNIYKIDINNQHVMDRYGHYYVIKKKLTENNKLPILFAMAGFSQKSFCGSANVIFNNIDKVKHKFQSVYIMCHGTGVKKLSVDAYKIWEKLEPVKKNLYKDELSLNKELAKITDKIIRSIVGENKVHLLGKCAGGGVAIQTVILNNIYTGLYLSVPSSPNNVNDLKELGKDRIKSMVFRFSWQDEDPIEFGWGFCRDGKDSYDKTMEQLGALDYKGEIYSGKEHEISDQLFTELI
jgi:hypothetical protein